MSSQKKCAKHTSNKCPKMAPGTVKHRRHPAANRARDLMERYRGLTECAGAAESPSRTATGSRQRACQRAMFSGDVLPFGRLLYGEPNAVSNAIGYAQHYSRSHDAVIRVYDSAGNVTGTHEHKGDFKEP